MRRVPQTWLEAIWEIYDPYKYVLQWQGYGVTVPVANGSTFSSIIQPPEPAYIMGLSSAGWLAGSGGDVVFPYRIGIADPTGNDWTNGQWASHVVTGDDQRQGIHRRRPDWKWPREVRENQILNVSVLNNVGVNPGAITVDAFLWGHTPRPRARELKPLQPMQYVPQTWEEWVYSFVDPARVGLFRQAYGCTINAGAGLATQTNTIQVPNDIFVFGFQSIAWRTATGGTPTWPYRVGIRNQTFNDWTYGQWASSAVVGTDLRPNSLGCNEWQLPREVARNEVLVVTVDNNVNAASEAITVDVMIWGYELRERNNRALNLLSE